MKHIVLSIMLLCSMVIFTGCPDTDPVSPDSTNFKGYIYYSTAEVIYRMRLNDQTNTKLFSNARHPDITSNGEVLCVGMIPTQLMFSDVTGANRKTLLLQSFTDSKHKQYLNKPRISYNQQYVVYVGDNVPATTYVVSATDGSLVATIGDYSKSQPMISPSWAPDGSIIVQGWTSLNNGIYKVTPDFTSMQRIDPNLTNVSEPSVSPDGKSIAFIRDEQVWTMGFDGSNPTQLYAGGNYRFGMPTWSPDSKYIAVVNTLASSGHIHILDVQAKTLTEITKSHYVGSSEQLSWRY